MATRTKVSINTELLGIAWSQGTGYRIEAEENFVTESGGEEQPSPADTNLFSFTTNSSGPSFISSIPASGSTNVNNTGTAVLQYNRGIKANTGNIYLYHATGTGDVLIHTFDVTDTDEVVVSGNSITLNVTDLVNIPSATFYFTTDTAVVKDRDNFPSIAITSLTAARYTMTSAPVFVLGASVPANGATDVGRPTLYQAAPNSERDFGLKAIILEFDSNVEADTGNVYLYKASDDSLAYTWSVTDTSKVIFAQNKVSLSLSLGYNKTLQQWVYDISDPGMGDIIQYLDDRNWTSILEEGTEYYLKADAGSIVDAVSGFDVQDFSDPFLTFTTYNTLSIDYSKWVGGNSSPFQLASGSLLGLQGANGNITGPDSNSNTYNFPNSSNLYSRLGELRFIFIPLQTSSSHTRTGYKSPLWATNAAYDKTAGVHLWKKVPGSPDELVHSFYMRTQASSESLIYDDASSGISTANTAGTGSFGSWTYSVLDTYNYNDDEMTIVVPQGTNPLNPLAYPHVNYEFTGIRLYVNQYLENDTEYYIKIDSGLIVNRTSAEYRSSVPGADDFTLEYYGTNMVWSGVDDESLSFTTPPAVRGLDNITYSGGEETVLPTYYVQPFPVKQTKVYRLTVTASSGIGRFGLPYYYGQPSQLAVSVVQDRYIGDSGTYETFDYMPGWYSNNTPKVLTFYPFAGAAANGTYSVTLTVDSTTMFSDTNTITYSGTSTPFQEIIVYTYANQPSDPQVPIRWTPTTEQLVFGGKADILLVGAGGSGANAGGGGGGGGFIQVFDFTLANQEYELFIGQGGKTNNTTTILTLPSATSGFGQIAYNGQNANVSTLAGGASGNPNSKAGASNASFGPGGGGGAGTAAFPAVTSTSGSPGAGRTSTIYSGTFGAGGRGTNTTFAPPIEGSGAGGQGGPNRAYGSNGLIVIKIHS
jgi:hypothetical protein